MEKSIKLLENGFHPQTLNNQKFKIFVQIFKNELNKELNTINGKVISLYVENYSIFGFFSIFEHNNEIKYYKYKTKSSLYFFCLGNVTSFETYSLSGWGSLLYKKVNEINEYGENKLSKYLNDYSGRKNKWILLESGMSKDMKIIKYFKPQKEYKEPNIKRKRKFKRKIKTPNIKLHMDTKEKKNIVLNKEKSSFILSFTSGSL